MNAKNLMRSQKLNRTATGAGGLLESNSSNNNNTAISEDERTIKDYLKDVNATVKMEFYKEGTNKMNIDLKNSKILINAYVVFSILNFINRDQLAFENKNQLKSNTLIPFVIVCLLFRILICITLLSYPQHLILINSNFLFNLL